VKNSQRRSPWGVSFSSGPAAHEQIVGLLVIDLQHRDLNEEARVILCGVTFTTSASLQDVPEGTVHDPGLFGAAEHGVDLPGPCGPVDHDGALGPDPDALDPGVHEPAVEPLEVLLLRHGDVVVVWKLKYHPEFHNTPNCFLCEIMRNHNFAQSTLLTCTTGNCSNHLRRPK
jgi:hypothetical protein